LELDLHGTVPVWFKGDFEDVRVILKMLSHLHEVDVVVETKVGVDHDNTKSIGGHIDVKSQKHFENVDELGDDTLTIEEITATGNLNTPIRKYLDRLCAVRIMIRQSHLVVKCRRLQFPFKSFGRGSLTLETVRTDAFERFTKLFNINLLDKA